MPFVRLTRDPIGIAELLERVRSNNYGGYVTFAGDVRNHASGKTVIALAYEAYESLAEKELYRLALEAETKFGASCAAQHRLGPIPIGETAVAIAVGASHRSKAFDACRWLIDTIKETVPIWKLETYEDGTVWIEGDQSFPVNTG